MDPRLLEILVCPVTRQRLRLAERGELEHLNRLIDAGRARTREGKTPAPLAAALVTPDGQRFYPIEDGIPVLLAEEAILPEPAA